MKNRATLFVNGFRIADVDYDLPIGSNGRPVPLPQDDVSKQQVCVVFTGPEGRRWWAMAELIEEDRQCVHTRNPLGVCLLCGDKA